MILTKTNFLTCIDCAKNAWLKIHNPEVYQKYPLSSFELNIIDTGNKIFTIEEALEKEILPCKKCIFDKNKSGIGWCRCCYAPHLDD